MSGNLVKKLQTNMAIPLLIVLIVAFILKDNAIIRGGINSNDLNGNLGGFGFVAQIIKTEGRIPMWNPYIGHGIPVLADPLNIFFSPFIFIPYLVFNYILATKVFFFGTILFSTLSMYFFARSMSRNVIFSLLLSFTYAFGGYQGAQLVSGHIEKTINYALLPLLIWTFLLVSNKTNFKNIFLHSLVLLSMFLSGGIYELFYYYIGLFGLSFCLIVGVFIKRVAIQNTKIILAIGLSSVLWPLLGAFKVLPFLETTNLIQRGLDPYLGSLKLQDIAFSLFIPPIGSWYEKINKLTPFPWWEQVAYIGPGISLVVILLLSLALFKKMPYWNKSLYKLELPIICIFLVTNIFYLGIDSIPYNPIKAIFQGVPIIQNFRAPSRSLAFTVIYLLTLLIVLWPRISNSIKYKNIIYMILAINLLFVIAGFKNITLPRKELMSFPKVTPLSKESVDKIKKDKSVFFVAQHPFYNLQPSLLGLIENKMNVLNPNYGWGLKGTSIPNFSLAEFLSKPFLGPYPKYIIYPNGGAPGTINNIEIIDKGNYSIFRSDKYTPLSYSTNTLAQGFPRVNKDDNQYLESIIEADRYVIKSNNKSGFRYVKLLVSFHPGWEAYIDNNRVPIVKSENFISVQQKTGMHTYKFIFNSKTANNGMIISAITLLLLLATIIFQRITKLKLIKI